MKTHQISIEGRVSTPQVQEAVKKYGMRTFKNHKGYIGYVADVDEPTADAFAAWHEDAQPAGTWIEAGRHEEGAWKDFETYEKPTATGAALRTSSF